MPKVETIGTPLRSWLVSAGLFEVTDNQLQSLKSCDAVLVRHYLGELRDRRSDGFTLTDVLFTLNFQALTSIMSNRTLSQELDAQVRRVAIVPFAVIQNGAREQLSALLAQHQEFPLSDVIVLLGRLADNAKRTAHSFGPWHWEAGEFEFTETQLQTLGCDRARTRHYLSWFCDNRHNGATITDVLVALNFDRIASMMSARGLSDGLGESIHRLAKVADRDLLRQLAAMLAQDPQLDLDGARVLLKTVAAEGESILERLQRQYPVTPLDSWLGDAGLFEISANELQVLQGVDPSRTRHHLSWLRDNRHNGATLTDVMVFLNVDRISAMMSARGLDEGLDEQIHRLAKVADRNSFFELSAFLADRPQLDLDGAIVLLERLAHSAELCLRKEFNYLSDPWWPICFARAYGRVLPGVVICYTLRAELATLTA